MSKIGKGFIHIYTGSGKGKTTAALGQAIRAAGSQLKTLIIMFMKEFPYGEVRALGNFEEWITIERYGNDKFVYQGKTPGRADIETAHKALNRAREAILSGLYDLVILDEICVTTYFKLLHPEDVLPILENKPEGIELILTGRYCPDEWIECADLVTEMTEVKHYYQKGVKSRKGIES